MAGTITWEQLQELAAFRATHGCAVSVYMGLDPSMVPTPIGEEHPDLTPVGGLAALLRF